MKNRNNIIPQSEIEKQERKQKKSRDSNSPPLFMKHIKETFYSDDENNGNGHNERKRCRPWTRMSLVP